MNKKYLIAGVTAVSAIALALWVYKSPSPTNHFNKIMSKNTDFLSKRVGGNYDSQFPITTAIAIDGDTIALKYINGKKDRIRLFAVNAPELNTVQGIKAYGALKDIITKGTPGNTPFTHCYATNQQKSHSRTVAVCYNAKGQDIALELIKLGLVYTKSKYFTRAAKETDTLDFTMHLQLDYINSELQARKEKIGIWK